MRVDGQFVVEPKGATHRLQLFEIGGIGKPFDLSLPERSKRLVPLPAAVLVRFTVLEEKFVGRTVHSGRLVALSNLEGDVESDTALAPLCNLKIELDPQPGANPGGEIYAKVIGPEPERPTQTRIRFTSVSPELKAWVHQIGDAGLNPSQQA